MRGRSQNPIPIREGGFTLRFRVTLHDPDGVHESITLAAKRSLDRQAFKTLTDEEFDGVVEARAETLDAIAARWIDYGEYVTIEIDTDKGEARVVQPGE